MADQYNTSREILENITTVNLGKDSNNNATKTQVDPAIGRAMAEVVKSQTRTEENDFYTVSQKAYKTAAITSVFLPNIQNAQAISAYNNINFQGNNAASQYFQSIGVMNNFDHNHVVDVQANVQGKLNLKSLTDTQLNSLKATGSFQQNNVTVSVSQTTQKFLNAGHQVSQCNCTAVQGVAANMKTFSANDFKGLSSKGQIDLMSSDSHDLINNFNAAGIDISNPSTAGSINVNLNEFINFRQSDYQMTSLDQAVTNHGKLNAMDQIYNHAMRDASKDSNLASIANARNPQDAMKTCEKVANDLTIKINESTKHVSDKDLLNLLQKRSLTNEELKLVHSGLLKNGCSDVDTLMTQIQSRNKAFIMKDNGIFHASSNSFLRKNGIRYIANYVLGEDMSKGINTVVHTKAAVQTGVRAAYALTNPYRHVGSKFGTLLEEKTAGIADNVISKIQKKDYHGVSKFTENKRNKKLQRKMEYREKMDARRGNRTTRQEYEFNQKQKRLDLKEQKLDKRIEKYKSKGNAKKYEKYKSRKNKLFDKRERFLKRNEKFVKFKNKVASPFKKLFKPSELLQKIASKILSPLNALKGVFLAVGGFLLHVFLVMAAVGAFFISIYFVLHYISNPFGAAVNAINNKWQGAINQLKSVNYEQMIADITASELCASFEEAAKYDATKYYLTVESNNKTAKTSQAFSNVNTQYADSDFASNITTTWYVQPTYGEIGNCWVWEEADNQTTWGVAGGGHAANDLVYEDTYVRIEDRKSLSGFNENLVPIFNMMHTRFYTSIDYSNWEAALAYVYYMYAQSHDIACYDDSIKGRFINGIQYDDKKLGYSYVYENAHARSDLYSSVEWNGSDVTRTETDSCTNIYICGTRTGLSKGVLSYKKLNAAFFASNQTLFEKTISDLDPFVTTASYGKGWWIIDDSGDHSPKKTSASASYSGGTISRNNQKCTHSKLAIYDGAATDCGKEEHEHADDCYPLKETSRNLKGTCECEEDDEHVDACYNITYEADTSQDPTCGKDEHTHEAGNIENDDDCCFVRVAICCGHCGGHLKPTVDIVQKMTYEGLMQDDGFKVPKFNPNMYAENIIGVDISNTFTPLSSAKFIINTIKAALSQTGIEAWRDYWDNKSKEWFSPFPNSCYGFLKTLGRGVIASTDEDPAAQDMYQFSGWWKSPNVPKEEYLDLMTSIYGTFYNEPGSWNEEDDRTYNYSQEIWKMFAEFGVIFPTGNGQTLSEAEIQEYLDYFASKGCNAEQLSVIEWALRRVGIFRYACTGAAHQNGIYGEGGLSECSGYVSGVLSRALLGDNFPGSTIDNNAAGYAGMGIPCVDLGAIPPGAVVAHANGGTGYTGHVMIWLGWLENGPDGPGWYTAECTNSKGVNGSQIKKRSESYLKDCNWFNPTQKW